MGLLKSLKSKLIGSIKTDLNSALAGQRNLFNANIADALDDLLKSATGISTSNIPSEITSHQQSMAEDAAQRRKGEVKSIDYGKSTPLPQVEPIQFPTDQNSSFVSNWIVFRTLEQEGTQVGSQTRDNYEIRLFLPKIQDNISVTYKNEDIGLAGAVGQGMMDMEWGNITDTLGGMIEEGWRSTKQEVLDKVSQLRPFGTGVVQNPVKFQLFENVGFRTHSYQFDMHPYNYADSMAIQQIIYALKKSALPTVSTVSPRLFIMPAMWDIDIAGDIAKNMEKPLPSAITKVDVDYSGGHDMNFVYSRSGKNVTDAHPNGVVLSVDFTELITMDSDRYQKNVSVHRSEGISSVGTELMGQEGQIQIEQTSDQPTDGSQDTNNNPNSELTQENLIQTLEDG